MFHSTFPLFIFSHSPFSLLSSFLSLALSFLSSFFSFLLLFLFCTLLLIPFPPSFSEVFLSLVCVQYSYFLFSSCLYVSHFPSPTFVFSVIVLSNCYCLWVSAAPFQILVSSPLSCSVLTRHSPRVYFQLITLPLPTPHSLFSLLFSSTLSFLFHHFPLLHCFHCSLSLFSYSFSSSI